MSAHIRFIPVDEITDPLTITLGLSGASGSGKTYSALRAARGMAREIAGPSAKIGFVDTENRRALHYRAAFPEMVHFDMRAVDDAGNMVGFGPDRWIKVIDAAEAAGLPVVVIDSFSHSWEGVGGILDMQAEELERLVADAEKRSGGKYPVDASKFSEQAWISPKRLYRRLTDRIIRAKTNFIICTRAKPVRQAGFGDKARNARATKLRRDDVPWDISGDASLIFEMTAQMIMDPAHPGCPVHQIKCGDQFKAIFDPHAPITEATGAAMARWANDQAKAHEDKQILDAARAAARDGRGGLNAFWQSFTKGSRERSVIGRIMDELRALAVDADERKAADDTDEIDFGDTEATESQAPQRDKADPQRDSEAPLHDISEAAAKLIARLSRKGDIAELQALWSMQTFGADLDNLSDADRAAVTAAYDAMFTKLDGAAA